MVSGESAPIKARDSEALFPASLPSDAYTYSSSYKTMRSDGVP